VRLSSPEALENGKGYFKSSLMPPYVMPTITINIISIA